MSGDNGSVEITVISRKEDDEDVMFQRKAAAAAAADDWTTVPFQTAISPFNHLSVGQCGHGTG